MLDVELRETPSDPEWDKWVAATDGGHHLQTSGWAEVKAGAGWRASRILLRRDGVLVGGCQLLVRTVPVLGGLAYVPRGPVLASAEPDLLDALMAAVRGFARRRRIAVVKIQPPVDRPDLPAQLESRGLVHSDLNTAPIASVVTDVGADRTEDEIFTGLRATTRRRVRQAQKRGVTVRTGTAEDLPVLQMIIEATAERQGFAPYPQDYYRRLWDVFGDTGQAHLLVAEHEGVPLSAALLIAFGDTVLYKIGGWRDVAGSPPGINELMHWTGIRWAHARGFRRYDFEGIPLEVARAILDGAGGDPKGVAFFKLGFGGEPVVYPGTYDLVPDGLVGRVVRAVLPRAERFRGVVHRVIGRRA
jgi:lipid II:glycine glycyltransferase (peptidoglycan interpeptide bridge formation enzyme)